MIEELDGPQNARVEALKVAREVLVKRTSTAPFSSSTKVDTMDLVAVATWIVDGENPWKVENHTDAIQLYGPPTSQIEPKED